MATDAFEGWAVLELMGHRRLAGYVREAEIGGGSFIRIDVAARDDGQEATQFYSPGAVYCLTPCTEEAARAVAERVWETPAKMLALPAPVTVAIADSRLEECQCGHVAVAHGADPDGGPGPCRIEGCECGGFDPLIHEERAPWDDETYDEDEVMNSG